MDDKKQLYATLILEYEKTYINLNPEDAGDRNFICEHAFRGAKELYKKDFDNELFYNIAKKYILQGRQAIEQKSDMKKYDDLIKDLKSLNETYNKLRLTRTDDSTIKMGELLINFYNNVFLPTYTLDSDEIYPFVNIKLSNWAHESEVAIATEDYFALRTLLWNKGSKINDPSNLEKLIQTIESKI